MMLALVHGVIEFFRPASESSVLLKSLTGVSRLEYFNGIRRNLVAVNTSSGRAAKNWPIERFVEIVSWLIDEMNAHVVLVGSGDQECHARHIIDNLNSPHITSLVGRTTVREAIRIVAATKLYVGNDSGLTHAAARIGVPTVAIYSGIDPVAVWAPIGPHVTVIRTPVHCSPCHIRLLAECRNRHACILSIDTQFVKDVLARVFAEMDGRSEAEATDSPAGSAMKAAFPV
jgi:ADP-heptose:LPS heptosyltransferase